MIVEDLLPPTLADFLLEGDSEPPEPSPRVLLARIILADGVCGVPGDPGTLSEFEHYRRTLIAELREAERKFARVAEEEDEDPESVRDAARLLRRGATILRVLADLTYGRLCEIAAEDAREAIPSYQAAARRFPDSTLAQRLQAKADEARERARRFDELAAQTA